MQMSRIKNIVIAVLLLFNLFFLLIYVKNTVSEQAAERQMRDGVAALLEKNGIEMDSGAIEKIDLVQGVTSVISPEGEEKLSRALIGECAKQSGVSSVYSGDGGTVEFSAGGEFTAQITNEGESIFDDTSKRTLNYLTNMGIIADISDIEQSGEKEIVTVICTYENAEIFNCKISFEYEDNALRSVYGRYVSGMGVQERVQEKLISPYSAIMTLLEINKYDNIKRITRVTPGYFMSVSVFGEGELTPLWRIITEENEYFIDAKTGENMTLKS